MKLAEYRRKRDPGRTNEPFGPEPTPGAGPTCGGAFVVHLHDATRRHYDLRLEIGGVLASFAIPRGPSLDPGEKRLAVHTEDHPIEYLDFEAVIPEGQYGAGPMILWDRGRVRYLEDGAEPGLDKGKIDFELYGYKVRGRFALVRLKKSESGKDWLFFKKADAHASQERDLTVEQPRSVLSGLTVEELADAPRIAREIEEDAARLGAPAGEVDVRAMTPMLCSIADELPSGPEWLFELKLDGVRAIADKSGAAARISGRRLHDETARYPEIARGVRALAAERVVLDGEIVAFDDSGRPSFQRLGQRMHLSRPEEIRRAMLDVPVLYVVFDLLAIGARDLRPLPLRDRKRLLSRLLPAPGVLRVLDHIEEDGSALLGFCRERKLEGVVAKRASSRYRPGPKRTEDWLKMKCERDEELVVVAFTRGERGRARLGALDLATYAGDELVYRGKVGSGLDEATIDRLLALLAPLATDAPQASGKYSQPATPRTHVRPEVVVAVRFLGWSDEGIVRHPVFKGIREDVAPRACTVAPHDPERGPPPDPDAGAGAPSGDGAPLPPTAHRPERRVALTNRKKILWPEEGYAKEDLWRYYEAIAPTLLPYLADRPIMLVRYPDGIAGKHFYQWNVPPGMPDWVESRTIRREEDDKEVNVFLVEDVDSLLYIANLACIPIHVLASRAKIINDCDFLTVDLDVKHSTLAAAVEIALTLRELCTSIGLEGFVKTSGQTGLHVFVPLGPGVPFAAARALDDLLGRLLVERHPKTATMERVVSKRGPRVYVDTGQTGSSRTIVAPYSVRAVRGATVSTPLRWDEVTPALDPTRFTIRTVPERVAEVGDPMSGLLEARPDLPSALAKIEALVKPRRA